MKTPIKSIFILPATAAVLAELRPRLRDEFGRPLKLNLIAHRALSDLLASLVACERAAAVDAAPSAPEVVE